MKDSSIEGAQTIDHYNFFGVIIDAAYPYKNQQGKFICTVKVVDHSYHHRGGSDTVQPVFATVIIYAKRLDDLPVVTNIGDIIRVHRATMKQYQEQKQFHVNVFFNSSWCLFRTKTDGDSMDDMDGDMSDQEVEESKPHDEDQQMMEEDRATEREQKRKYRPYKFSGKTYTFDMNHEKVILDDLRSWTANYFAKEYVITKDMFMRGLSLLGNQMPLGDFNTMLCGFRTLKN